MKAVINTILAKSFHIIAKRFWEMCDDLDRMPEANLDDLVAKADAFAKMQKRFARLPKPVQEYINNTKRSDFDF